MGLEFDDVRVLNTPLPFYRSFEEINLRFYVCRRTGSGWRRGVVFVRELVSLPAVALLARHLYSEPYTTLAMKPEFQHRGRTVEYVVEHPLWRYWPTFDAGFECHPATLRTLYGEAFAPYLKSPRSAYLVEGSPVTVRRPRAITTPKEARP